MKVRFHSPHPGFGGPAISLPSEIKSVIDKYNGKTAEISDLLLELDKADMYTLSCWPPKYSINDEHHYITCRIETRDGCTHQWRLISWKDLND